MQRFVEQFGSVDTLRDEVSWLKALVSTLCHSPLVFAHNDTLIANFIYDEDTGICDM